MAEYIEREALLEKAQNERIRLGYDIVSVRDIESMPAADVVPVVRCKDCKHWGIREGNDPTKSYYCDIDGMWCKPCRLPHDFCSYGEKRYDDAT